MRIVTPLRAGLVAVLALAGGLTVNAVHATPATFRAGTSVLTVSAAIGAQGTTGTVRGYVVGQPTGTTTVLRSGFTGDTAIALADSASTTTTSGMLFVQVTSTFRAGYGLASNPGLMGRQIDVTGSFAAYFAHAGLTSPSSFIVPGPSSTATRDPGGYYAAVEGKSGPALRTALHQIISTGVTKLSYEQVWTALKVTDQDPADPNDVIMIYSGVSKPKSESGGGIDDWNREHVWAKSHGDFGTTAGPGTDLHHLRPEDVTVNSDRGNKDFDDGGSSVAEAPGNFTDSDSWEPRTAVKGDVARMIFYMAIRYEGGDGYPNLEVDNSVSSGTAPRIGRLTVLKEWNDEDPPDAFEQRRNQVIYDQFQHNRNPFIDHPEWVDSIF